MYEKLTLSNGVRILHEHIPYVRSVALGIWVGAGSRHESARMNGASHFIEHMLFKGTGTRTAAELAAIMDGIGGQVNAFTTKEVTCFHGRVLDTHMAALTDVLCDMFFNSRFDEGDVTNERGVIGEEIDMYSDTPEDLTSERLMAAVYGSSPLARPILGRKSTLARMTGDSLRTYMQAHYRPEAVVVAVSGNFAPQDIDRLARLFEGMEKSRPKSCAPAAYVPAFTVRRKSLEQNHLTIAFPGLAVTDDDRFALQILSDILGGGMSSRLFQSVRERLGLCYSVYSYGSSYRDTGIFAVYTALGRETEKQALQVIMDEIRRLKEDGVTPEEVGRTREQIKSNVLLGLESTGTRMSRLGRNELYFGRVPEPDEIIARYDAVAVQDVARLAGRCLDLDRLSFSAVGRVDTAEAYRALIC